jgi:hypothetical protein
LQYCGVIIGRKILCYIKLPVINATKYFGSDRKESLRAAPRNRIFICIVVVPISILSPNKQTKMFIL